MPNNFKRCIIFCRKRKHEKNVSKAKRSLSDLPHDSIYAHMNPNVVISTLNELSPKWALHKIPVQSLLEAMSKLGEMVASLCAFPLFTDIGAN